MDSYLAATSGDTVRTRSFTGKPARMLRNDWTEAWESPDAPDPLPLPLQGMVAAEAMARFSTHPRQSQDVAFNPVGQIVGEMNDVSSCRDTIYRLVEEYVDSVERLQHLLPTES